MASDARDAEPAGLTPVPPQAPSSNIASTSTATAPIAMTSLSRTRDFIIDALRSKKAPAMMQTRLPASYQPQRHVTRKVKDGDGHDDDDDDDDDSDENDEGGDGTEVSVHESEYESDGFSVDDIEKRLEQKNSLFQLDEDGMPHWKQHQSSYTEKDLRRRGHYSMSPMYDTCSAIELRKFVRERGLQDPYPEGATLKYFYLRVLDQADGEKSFRFLDLPPEMRNLVYTELLTFSPCDCCTCDQCGCTCAPKLCHTGILRSNKLVYKEAKDLLYTENTIFCRFAVQTNEHRVARSLTHIHNQVVHSPKTALNVLYEGMSELPHWLHHVHSLRIQIDAHGHGVFPAREFLQSCLLNLASYLLEGHRLKRLHVDVIDHLPSDDDDDDDDGEPDFITAVLYPLRCLRGLEHATFAGDVDQELSTSISTEMQREAEPVFNTLPHLHLLRSEATAYLNMAHSINPLWPNYRFDDHPELPLPGSKNDLTGRISWLLDEMSPDEDSGESDLVHFGSSEAEVNLRRMMEDLRFCLNSVKLRDFEQKKRKFVDAGAKRRELTRRQLWLDVDDGKANTSPGRHVRRWESRRKDY